jgi:hypothetical protein
MIPFLSPYIPDHDLDEPEYEQEPEMTEADWSDIFEDDNKWY